MSAPAPRRRRKAKQSAQLWLFDEKSLKPAARGADAESAVVDEAEGRAGDEHPADDRSHRELLSAYVRDIVVRLGGAGLGPRDWWAGEDAGTPQLKAYIAIQPEEEELIWLLLWSDEDGWRVGLVDNGGDRLAFAEYMHRSILPSGGHVVAFARRVAVQGYEGHRAPPGYRRWDDTDDFGDLLRAAAAKADESAKVDLPATAVALADRAGRLDGQPVVSQCGTGLGYQRHLDADEPPCERCATAVAEIVAAGFAKRSATG